MNVSAEHRYTLALLLALTGTSAFSLQFFVPAMPDLVTIFETTPAMVQLTLTLFMLTYGIFQAVYGPLSDRFGRKPVLLVAIVIYVAGSFLGAAASSIELVIAARVLQAVGAAAGFVLVPAIARDVYGHGGAPRAMSYISMTNGFISAAGPLIGGLIHQYAGWRWGLLATGTLGASMLVMTALYLKESGVVVRQRVALAPILRGYVTLAKTRGFMGYVLAVSSVNGVFYAFLAGAAFVAIDTLGVSPSGFGLFMIPLQRPRGGAHRHDPRDSHWHLVHGDRRRRTVGRVARRSSKCGRVVDCKRLHGFRQRPGLAVLHRRGREY